MNIVVSFCYGLLEMKHFNRNKRFFKVALFVSFRSVIHQNKTPTPRSNLLEKRSYFDFMLFLGDFSGPSRIF